MAVVRNLMIRVGADFSPARKGLQGATHELNRFKKDTEKTTQSIGGRRGLGGIATEFRNLSNTVSSSLSRLRGARGISGVTSELKNLRPLLSNTTRGLGSLGASAAGAGAAFGSAAVGIGAFVAALGLATVGIYKASQEAVRFEADIGRLNISLREGARGYMEWARAQGLAKQSAADLGATYANLLGSFISDTDELRQSTQDLVHATRVIASYTGRSLDDVFNRIRSGMLGSTEAIEDLGVYVNISMIESTKAFRKFAGDKSWSQLDFQTQQQIRLAAILEQTYARYGNKLQNAVMTKQEILMEQFKDIKLHLSQAFLPIWDAVLPALTRMAEALARTSEELARFMYWLRGWDYDEMTSGTDRQTGAVEDQGRAYDDLADSAKKAKNELAGFDRLNLLGSPGGTGGTSGSGSGSGGGGFAPPAGPGAGGGWNIDWPEIPPELTRRYRIEFDPPRPPDAGMGAVATAVTTTVNGMVAEAIKRQKELWNTSEQLAREGISLQGQLANEMQARWVQTWEGVNLATQTGVASATEQLGRLYEYANQKSASSSEAVSGAWKESLSSMQQNMNAYRPYLEWGWHLIGKSARDTIPSVKSTEQAWAESLAIMNAETAAKMQSIRSELNQTARTWESLLRNLGTSSAASAGVTRPMTSPVISPTSPLPSAAGQLSKLPSSTSAPDPWEKMPTGRARWVDENPVLGPIYGFLDKVSEKTAPASMAAAQYMVPGAQIGGAAQAGRAATGVASKFLDDIIQGLSNLFKGGPATVPGFASGAVVYGPTLAMVGEYPGASSNPEVIAPLDTLEGMIDNAEQTAILREILKAIRSGQNVQVTITEGEIARAAINGHNRIARMTGESPLVL